MARPQRARNGPHESLVRLNTKEAGNEENDDHWRGVRGLLRGGGRYADAG